MTPHRRQPVSRLTGHTLIFALAILALGISATVPVSAQQMEYQRQAEVAPSEEVIGEGYVTPEVQHPLSRSLMRQIIDVVLLGLAMGFAAWLALRRRSRAGLVTLTAVCVAYFGFYREGCICPIGSIQNVAFSLFNPMPLSRLSRTTLLVSNAPSTSYKPMPRP